MVIKLNEYLEEKITKDRCPLECEFQSKKIEIAKVPAPEEIFGILISRDPTVKWLDKGYRRAWKIYKEQSNAENLRNELFRTAIPKKLKEQISKFIVGPSESAQLKCLFTIIDTKVYWSHLHKCFTDGIKYKCTNSTRCADKWLKEELRLAMADNNIKFIIALGNNVQEWLEGWRRNNRIDMEIINLLHPSDNNNRYWSRSKKNKYRKKIEETEEQIKRLVSLCQQI